MKTYKIIHEETLVSHFYIDAENPKEAMKEYWRQVSNGELDFNDATLVDSSDRVEEEDN